MPRVLGFSCLIELEKNVSVTANVIAYKHAGAVETAINSVHFKGVDISPILSFEESPTIFSKILESAQRAFASDKEIELKEVSTKTHQKELSIPIGSGFADAYFKIHEATVNTSSFNEPVNVFFYYGEIEKVKLNCLEGLTTNQMQQVESTVLNHIEYLLKNKDTLAVWFNEMEHAQTVGSDIVNELKQYNICL